MEARIPAVSIMLIALSVCSCFQSHNKKDCFISSPSGKIRIHFTLDEGAPRYTVSYEGIEVIRPSTLGFRFAKAKPLIDGLSIVKSRSSSFNETWEPVWGQRKAIQNQYREMKIELAETEPFSRKLHIVFRAYDDGIAFRYVFPEQSEMARLEIVSEETTFALSADHSVWWIPDDYESYEHLYRQTPLSRMPGANTPVTMETPEGLFLSIHEADLTDWAGMTLKPIQGQSYTLKSTLVPWPDGIKVKASVPHRSPWRTVQIADEPGDLIESSLILNLNRPCVLPDTEWIKPMKYVGIWWGMHIDKVTWHAGSAHGATTKNAKDYIDFAAKHGIPALLIEGWNIGWESWFGEDNFSFTQPYDDFDLKEVVHYGHEKGVLIIGHHETGGGVPNYEKQIDDAFALYRDLGIPAIKTGYAGKIRPEGQHHHGQWMVNHYRMVIKKAADYHLMIDAHEPIKPTGISRTYPNFLTREGGRGMEYNAWSEGNPPDHTTILPFTRLLAGPMDYTPGIFDLEFDAYKKENRVHTTLAKQLALMVVLFSPLQMAADLVENYIDTPHFSFIQTVPTTWDETRVLKASIGDFVSIARRRGERWFIGSITDENARTLELDLSFLKRRVTYSAELFCDGAGADYQTDPYPLSVQRIEVDYKSTIEANLVRGGGQAIILSPVPQKD